MAITATIHRSMGQRSSMDKIDIEEWNKKLRHKSHDEVIEWALNLTKNRIVTTSFGKYSAVLLSTFQRKAPDIKVIWCDSGYNIPETYAHAEKLISRFDLNLHTYLPRFSKGYIDYKLGLPTVDDPLFDEFSELVKLEPFRRAIHEHQPDLWFTNIRVRQTEHRDNLDKLSYSKDGILKVSPFYYWSDEELDEYLKQTDLPKNTNYFDPIKALENRECGIHLQ